MNNTKQCMNSEPCEVTVHARKRKKDKKKKEEENADVRRGMQTVTLYTLCSLVFLVIEFFIHLFLILV